MNEASAISQTTEQLQQCFERIFQSKGITSDSDFFDLGGDSLAAAQLLLEIENTLGIKLRKTALIQYPSITALAHAIEQNSYRNPNASIIPVQAAGHRPPLFMMHSYSGSLWPARNLGHHLTAEQPLFGFSPADGPVNFNSLGELAVQYSDALISGFPRESYRLIGYSFGGILAFETARELRDRGHAVDFLGIIDTHPEQGPEMWKSRNPDLRDRWVQFRSHREQDGMAAAMLWATAGIIRKLGSAMNAAWMPKESEDAFEQAARKAFFEHAPGFYDGDVTLFATEQLPDGEQAWGRLISGKVEIFPVTGDHVSIAQSPGIEQIATYLEKVL